MPQLKKSWLLPLSGQKKFITSVLGYRLSKEVDRGRFEVVTESFLDVHDLDSEQPDVVIYNKQKDYHADLIIENVTDDDLENAIRSMEIFRKIYHISEAFVLNISKMEWYKVGDTTTRSDYSNVFNIKLDTLLASGLSTYSPR